MFRKIPFYSLLLSGSLLFFSTITHAQQQITVSGRFQLPADESVVVGNVALLHSPDSAVLKIAPVTNNGFKLDLAEKGLYLLRIVCAGYNETVQPLQVSGDTSIIVPLTTRSRVLDEVQVYGNKEIFTTSNGNIRVNVDNPILQASSGAMSLLSKLPGLQVGPDGESLTLLGKGMPLIYLDNQRITISDLQSIPVHEIKSIEILNNPSARYESEGRAVILVTRKFSQRDGFKIDLTENVAQRRYFQNSTSAEVSYRKNKLELRANAQYNHFNLWESNGNEFGIEGQDISSDYTVVSKGPRKQWLLGAGLHYQFNDNDYLSLSGNTRIHHETFAINTNSDLRNMDVTTNALTYTDNGTQKPYYNASLNYFKQFKKNNLDMFFGGQYSHFERNLSSNIYNSIDDAPMVFTQQRLQDFSLNAGSGKLEFAKKLGKNSKLEFGGSYTKAWADAVLDIDDKSAADHTHTLYHYAEAIGAGYAQFGTKIGHTSIDAGLRLEKADAAGKFSNDDQLTIDRHNLQLFPKFNIGFQVDSTRTLSFNYGRSIIRPNYSNLSQIITYINPFFEWASNINLVPTITDEAGATFQLGNNSVQLVGYIKKNPVYYSASFDASANKFQVIDQNFDKEQGVNLSFTVPFTVKKWNSTNILTGTVNKTSDANSVNLKTTPYVYFYTGNQFSLPKDVNVFANFWVLTGRYEGIFRRNALSALDLGASKTFNNKLVVTLNLNDVYRGLNFSEKLTANAVSSNVIYYEDVREISLNIRYTLGSVKKAVFKNKEVNDNMNRIR
ncbi:Outer membrane receptor proteins, mostly Fe transport [Chitinophaga costaii]|uniref:Outer membrane receptor proteins, mostly Fe transport n=1 Tax=Chitinophaga costaii TaxID=1335309 RepID=A0A1C4FWZ7_9BACT|nr:TonB-dependent receptor [Chitinophaga costaii]SCC60529.1 Outer membrane receptor proteins, mostly Fe transport [Chitinophaga costaii]